uniref:Uncharacterized protein n=1 Tax=Cannabis sativa TaxID=3483 RepID=A0A803NXQ1_CANSA
MKLNHTRKKLMLWNTTNFEFCKEKGKILDKFLMDIQKRLPSRENIQLEADILLEIEEVLSRQCEIRRQKYRETWLRDGDRNSYFFHALKIVRRKRNFIGAISKDGENWIGGRRAIGDYFSQKFKMVYQSSNSVFTLELEELVVPYVSVIMNDRLYLALSSEEIIRVV